MKKRIVLIGLLILGGTLNAFSVSTDADSTKGKYPLNDPRNPNCPCHQYQAQADREYALMTGKNVANLQSISSSNGSDQKVARKVKVFHWRNNMCRKRTPKHPTKKAFRDKLSRCFHF